jgi:hypothetical protein
MGLQWPAISNVGGNLQGYERQALSKVLDEFADAVAAQLTQAGFPLYASPMWRPWNLVVVRDPEKILAAFSPLQGGVPNVQWIDQPSLISAELLIQSVVIQTGTPVATVATLPRPDAPGSSASITAAVNQHLAEVERANRLGRLGDLTGLTHLEPYLRQFLDVHPNPDRNVFVIMRFIDSPQMNEVYSTIRDACSAYGFHATRADDRDYTGDLWSNIEVYMTCCQYAIAVFEDIEKRDFNPNVSLELGYMIGRRKRSLILKEQRLPNLPADVVHKLYKPFDMFKISDSITREVTRWIEVDLGIPRLSLPN